MTDRAIFFQAKAKRFSPEVSLIVKKAARLEGDVAAQGSHAPQLGSGDQGRCSAEAWRERSYQGVEGQIVQGGQGADEQVVAVVDDPFEALYPPDVHHHVGLEQTVLEVGNDIGAARHDLGAAPGGLMG